MSYGEPIVVDWSIKARVKGHGKPFTHVSIGSAAVATEAMIAWLESVRGQVEGDAPVIDVQATLTSQQRPGWKHIVASMTDNLPVGPAFAYTIDWLRKIAKVSNWGGPG